MKLKLIVAPYIVCDGIVEFLLDGNLDFKANLTVNTTHFYVSYVFLLMEVHVSFSMEFKLPTKRKLSKYLYMQSSRNS